MGGAMFCFCLWGYFELAEDYPEGKFQNLDAQVLQAFRHADDPAHPRGPGWAAETMRDLSALGSPLILGILIVSVLGFIGLARERVKFVAIALSVTGGVALTALLKAIAHRPRPEIVPHLTEVSSSSFPSGHSMQSAVILLTLGALLAESETSVARRIYILSLAAILTFGIGVSRIYLGVHYPTDVLAGWCAGVAWALICGAVYLRFRGARR